MNLATMKSAMVNLNVYDIDEHEEKVSLHIFPLFIQHILLLTIVLLLLNCCATNLIFEQTIQRRAIVPVDIVVQELGISRTKRISQNRKGNFIFFFLLSNIFPF